MHNVKNMLYARLRQYIAQYRIEERCLRYEIYVVLVYVIGTQQRRRKGKFRELCIALEMIMFFYPYKK